MEKFNPRQFSPKTNADPEMLGKMRTVTREMIKQYGGVSAFSIQFGYPYLTVRQWNARGRIGATIVNELCKNKQLIKDGFTREILRPDIAEWLI